MSIRLKLFLLLLTFSLVPLLIITATSRQSIDRLGNDLSREAGAYLMDTISQDLIRSAQTSANAISQDVARLQLSLNYLAGSAKHALTVSAVLPETRIYSPEDFKDPETAPPDLQMSWRYARVTDGGVLMPSGISTRYPVVVAPAKQTEPLAPFIHRLQLVTPVFRDIYTMNNTLAHRVYIGFTNGLHISYPGHGHLPENFDPRSRPWFADTRARGDLTWLSHTDASTRSVVFTIGLPIKDNTNRLVGVGAIDLLPGEFMKMDQLRAKWSPDTRAFLVLPESRPSAESARLRIIATGSPSSQATGVLSETADSYLELSDANRGQAFVDRMHAVDSGHMEMAYANTPSIWAFAKFKPPVDEALRLVLIVPATVVTALSQQVREDVLDQSHHMYRVTGIIAILLLALVLLVGWGGTRRITKPIYAMVRAWERLSTGDFTVRLHHRTGDERDTLINAFNNIVPRLEAHWNLSQSMELARQIQRNLLPDQAPALPGVDLAGDSHYCDETGGDYYDVFKTGGAEEKCFAVVVGDVSGHGVASALLMTTARALIRSISVLEEDTARRITLVNQLLYPDTTDSGNFITLFYLELDMTQRQLRWIRAGHDPAILYNPHEDQFSELAGVGMALGIEAEFAFSTQALEMGIPGQIIVIGTDGIWEAHNPQREMFGKERLREVIRSHHHLGAQAIRDAVFKAVIDFTGPDQDDDITLVVIKLL